MITNICRSGVLVFCLFLIPGGPARAAGELAGHVVAIKGTAQTISQEEVTTNLKGGSPVHVGDIVTTGKGARLIILLEDDARLTLGEKARLMITDMIYDGSTPSQGVQQQAIKVAQGVFRFVSGEIGKARPDSVVINTPVATIGIRGTSFVAGELTVGMPPGQPHYGVQIEEGAIEVTSPAGAVILDDPGEGTFLPLTRVAAPTPVRPWTEDEAAEARAALAFR